MPKVLSKDGLTPKQRLALKDYLDPNSSTFLNKSASVKAHYNANSTSSASVIADYTITDENIEKLRKSGGIQDKLTDPVLIKKLSADNLLSMLYRIVQLGIDDKTKTKAKTSDATKAIELIGKFKELNLFRDSSVVEEINKTEITDEKTLDEEFRELINSKQKK